MFFFGDARGSRFLTWTEAWGQKLDYLVVLFQHELFDWMFTFASPLPSAPCTIFTILIRSQPTHSNPSTPVLSQAALSIPSPYYCSLFLFLISECFFFSLYFFYHVSFGKRTFGIFYKQFYSIRVLSITKSLRTWLQLAYLMGTRQKENQEVHISMACLA